MLCGEIGREGPGCGYDISLTLRENHKEDKFPGLRDDLTTLLGKDQVNNTRRDCFGGIAWKRSSTISYSN